MMSPREEFMKKLRKGLATSAIVLSGAASITGCESKNIEPEAQVVGTVEAQTTKSFEDLTKDEKEAAKTVIEQKEILLDKVLENYQKAYPERNITEKDFDIIMIEGFSAWVKEGIYYIDENTDIYNNYTKVERSDKDYDMIIVEKRNNKILFAVSKINGKTKESNLNKYFDKETGHNYINAIEYKSIINNKYTAKQCLDGMKSLQKYRENKEYYDNIKRNINIIEIEELEI